MAVLLVTLAIPVFVIFEAFNNDDAVADYLPKESIIILFMLVKIDLYYSHIMQKQSIN